MDVSYPEKYWAVHCKRKTCRNTIRFAAVKREDPQLYTRVVALECPNCKERRRYAPQDIFRERANVQHSFTITKPLFEEETHSLL